MTPDGGAEGPPRVIRGVDNMAIRGISPNSIDPAAVPKDFTIFVRRGGGGSFSRRRIRDTKEISRASLRSQKKTEFLDKSSRNINTLTVFFLT